MARNIGAPPNGLTMGKSAANTSSTPSTIWRRSAVTMLGRRATASPLSGSFGAVVQSRYGRAAEECRIAAQDETNEVLEDGLFDHVAVEFQRDAVEAIHIDQRNGNDAGLIIGSKRDHRPYRRRDRKRALAQTSARFLDSAGGVLEPRVVERLFGRLHHARRDFNRKRLGRRDFVVDVDLVEHREPDDPMLVLSDRTMPETRRLKHEPVA